MSILNYPPDKKIQNYQFSFKSKLGKGAYGTVYAGRNILDQSIVALKVIEKRMLQSDYAVSLIASEIEIMKKIDHSNIVKLIDVLHSVNNTYIITEYCNGGDLREYLKRKKQLPESEAMQIFKGLLLGVRSLLKLGIIHRDIKPANIMIHDGVFKITDFGFAKQVDSHIETIMNSLVGTPLYMSPQILKRQSYTSKCDIWSIGLIFYEMLYGTTPWHSQNLVELMSKLESKPLAFPSSPKISDTTKQLIRSCLQITEEKRINWDQLFALAGVQEPIEGEKEPEPNRKVIENIENKHSIYTQRLKQRTESICQYPVTNKHNRSLSNTSFMQIEQQNKICSNERPMKAKLSYLEAANDRSSSRYKTELEYKEQAKLNPQAIFLRFNTQRMELNKVVDNVCTPPLPTKKTSSNTTNDSFRTPSALQSHSTNASNRNTQEPQAQDTTKVNEFQVEEGRKYFTGKQLYLDVKLENTEEQKKQLPALGTNRYKRTNSLSNNFTINTSPITNQKKSHIAQLLKIVANQQDLIPNHIVIKQSISTMLKQHRDLLQNQQSDLIYSQKEVREIKQILYEITEYLNKNNNDHFIIQLQVMVLLLLNYLKLISSNIATKSLVFSNSLIELIKKNQHIQQNQLNMDPKVLRDNIRAQASN